MKIKLITATYMLLIMCCTLSVGQALKEVNKISKPYLDLVRKKDEQQFARHIAASEKAFSDYIINTLYKDSIFLRKASRTGSPDEVNQELKRYSEKQREGYQRLISDPEYQSIDWNNATYIDTYFKINRRLSEPFITEADLKIHFKTKTNFYILELNDVLLFSNKWYGGIPVGIYEVDKYNERNYGDRNYDYPDSVAADTTAMVISESNDKIMQGDIGGNKIVLKLETRDKYVFGKYYYEKYLKDIELMGTKEGDDIILKHVTFDGNKQEEIILEKFIVKNSDAGYEGVWESNNKKLPVVLTPLVSESIEHPYLVYDYIKDDSYSFSKTAKLKFKELNTQLVNGKYTIKWFTDSLGLMKFFKIENGLSKVKMDFINNELMREYLFRLNNLYSGVNKVTPVYEVSNIFITPSIFSFAAKSNISSEDIYNIRINLNLRAFTELQLESFVYFPYNDPNTAAEVEDNGMDSTVAAVDLGMSPDEYLINSQGRIVVEEYTKLYPDKMNSCGYSNPQSWIYGNWYFTSKGLYIGTSDVLTGTCRNPKWAIIPYNELEKYYTEEGRILLKGF